MYGYCQNIITESKQLVKHDPSSCISTNAIYLDIYIREGKLTASVTIALDHSIAKASFSHLVDCLQDVAQGLDILD